jgi:hypothetical protein
VRIRLILLSCLPLIAAQAHAYGPGGHIIAGLAAEPLVCADARATIARLAGGASLADIGLWADRVRGDERWAHAAPWHYINVPDAARLRDVAHPPEGDVLEAIERYRAVLGDRRRDDAERLEALRWLVHLVVDIHQPLHVGRAEDRGGNRIDVHYEDKTVNLHAFWDTDAIALAGLRPRAYAARIAGRVRELAARERRSSAEDWATESLGLRAAVYEFDAATGRLSAAYLRTARRVTEERLALAAARLANTLDAALCG